MTHSVAVVGLGYFSQFHLTSWQSIPGAELIAATDPDPTRRAWAKAHGVPVVDDLDAVLACAPEVVDIVAPPPVHAQIIRASLAPGRTLICQKPFCTSLDEARRVTQEAERAGATLLIHENFRFQPWYRTLKTALAPDRMGQVWSARFALRPGDGRGADAYLERQPAFRAMPRLLIHETGVHFIDLFRWLFGEITDVYADLRQLNPVLKGEDAGLMILTHDSGVRSTFDGNRLADHQTDAPRRTMGELVIEGEGGTLSLDGYGVTRFRAFGAQHSDVLPPAYPPDESFGGGCVAALNRHIIAARDGTGAFENEARSYLPVIRVSDLAYEAARAGRNIPVQMEGP